MNVKNKNDQQISLLSTKEPKLYSCGNSVLFQDISKIMTLYILHQYVRETINKPFDMLHFDDRTDLLDGIDCFYQEYLMLLPKNVIFQNVEWNSHSNFNELTTRPRPVIYGQGQVNLNYVKDVKDIAQSFFPKHAAKPDELIKRLVEKFKKYLSTSINVPEFASISGRRHKIKLFDFGETSVKNENELAPAPSR